MMKERRDASNAFSVLGPTDRKKRRVQCHSRQRVAQTRVLPRGSSECIQSCPTPSTLSSHPSTPSTSQNSFTDPLSSISSYRRHTDHVGGVAGLAVVDGGLGASFNAQSLAVSPKAAGDHVTARFLSQTRVTTRVTLPQVLR